MAQLPHEDPNIVKSTSLASPVHYPKSIPPTPSNPNRIIPTPFPTPHTKLLANRHIRITTTTDPPSRQQPHSQQLKISEKESKQTYQDNFSGGLPACVTHCSYVQSHCVKHAIRSFCRVLISVSLAIAAAAMVGIIARARVMARGRILGRWNAFLLVVGMCGEGCVIGIGSEGVRWEDGCGVG